MLLSFKINELSATDRLRDLNVVVRVRCVGSEPFFIAFADSITDHLCYGTGLKSQYWYI